MTHSKYSAALDKLLITACITAIGAFLINQINDIDIWWHIVIGREILSSQTVPVTEHFTAAAFGRPYHDCHWLFQVVIALADQTAGMLGVQVFMILCWTAAFWFCWRAIMRRTPMYQTSPLAGTLLLFLAAMASIERFNPRPEIVTLLMIALFYWLLQERKYLGVKGLLLFGLLQVIWTNAHGLFVIGPFMAGCYWLAAALRRMRGDEPNAVHLTVRGEPFDKLRANGNITYVNSIGDGPDFIPLSQLLGVLALATLITPFGWEGWRFAIQLFSEVGPWSTSVFKMEEELSPTFGATNRAGVAFWFFAALLAITILTTILAAIPAALRRQFSLARLLIVAGLLATALSGRRNMPLFALVAAPFVAENLRLLFPQGIRNANLKTALNAALALAMLGWSWYPLSGSYYLHMALSSRFGWGVTPSFFPHDLPQILERSGFNGQIYNTYSLGGFYLYHGYPQRLPLFEGRTEIYDTKILEAIYNAPYNPTAWTWMVQTYDIRGLLLQHGAPEARALLPKLRISGAWRLVYYDNAISFWMRSDTPHPPPAIDFSTTTLPPKPSRPDDCILLNEFLYRMEADELLLQNLQRALEYGWDTESLLVQTGQIQIKLQRFDQAKSTFGHLLHDSPDNLYAIVGLAFIAYQRGELATAEALLHRALEIAPDDANIRKNHLRIKTTLDQTAVNRAAQGQIR
jgi:tetratricopeptide (TPR) repeat protein